MSQTDKRKSIVKHIKVTLNSSDNEVFEDVKENLDCSSNAEVFRILMRKAHKKIVQETI